MTKLFDENGKPIGLYELAEWWIETYPDDIFITGPKLITEIRDRFIEILKKKSSGINYI